jgi:triphosphoribosyl-dephospho-CoA synthase
MDIWEASEYACIIEAGTFKPGNVDSRHKEFLDYVVSALLLGRSIQDMLDLNEIHLGRFIKEAVIRRTRIVPSNTNLGIILLHIPLAVAASANRMNMRQALDTLVRTTTVEDAVDVAEALRISNAHLGTPQKGPDVRNGEGAVEIHKEGLTLADLFSLSSSWDSIALEWVTGFPITFSAVKNLMEGDSILDVYLDILSRHPDSLIQRKFGVDMAQKVSEEAGEIRTEEDLRKWDEYLRRHDINPGTTADLVAAGIFVALLEREDMLQRFVDEARSCQDVF